MAMSSLKSSGVNHLIKTRLMRSVWQSAREYESIVGFFHSSDVTHVALPEAKSALCGDDLVLHFLTDALTIYTGVADIKAELVDIRETGKHLCMECWDVLTGIEKAMEGVKDEFRQTVSRNDREYKGECLVRSECGCDGRGRNRVRKEIPVAECEVNNCETDRGSITITTIGGKE